MCGTTRVKISYLVQFVFLFLINYLNYIDIKWYVVVISELPASAAQEPPPTPKTQPVTSLSSSAPAMSISNSMQPGVSTIVIPASSFNTLLATTAAPTVLTSSQVTPVTTATVQTSQSPTHQQSPPIYNLGSPYAVLSPSGALSPLGIMSPPSIPSPLGALSPVGGLSPCGSTGKKEPPPPLELASTISTSQPMLGMTNNSNDFLNTFNSDLTSTLNDQFPTNMGDLPFITMDWSDSETNMNSFDLPSALDTPDPLGLNKSKAVGHDLLIIPNSTGSSRPGGSVHGSEPNLNSLEFNDNDITDEATAMNLDVSDWLDVIMPSTGLTPLSANAPVSFPSDPILTPKPQDVLDLFNMEESDLYTPTELCSGIFENAMETSISKS